MISLCLHGFHGFPIGANMCEPFDGLAIHSECPPPVTRDAGISSIDPAENKKVVWKIDG